MDPVLSAAKHAQSAARLTEESLSTLNRPIVTVPAQYVEYEKTLSLDLTGPRRDALDSTDSFLDSIPGSVAPEFQAIASDIVGRISQALPGLFAALPSDVSYRFRQSVFRPTVQGILPIYTGGAIARQRAPEVLVQPIFTTGGYRDYVFPAVASIILQQTLLAASARLVADRRQRGWTVMRRACWPPSCSYWAQGVPRGGNMPGCCWRSRRSRWRWRGSAWRRAACFAPATMR